MHGFYLGTGVQTQVLMLTYTRAIEPSMQTILPFNIINSLPSWHTGSEKILNQHSYNHTAY